MSVELTKSAFEVIETDKTLQNSEKLVLLRWAWKSVSGKTYEIKYRELARDLGLSRNAVKTAVRGLIAKGYLYEVSVAVRPGPKLQGGSLSDPFTQKQGGHSLTPHGSLTDPLTGHSLTPTKTKTKNTREMTRNSRWYTEKATKTNGRQAVSAAAGQIASKLTAFQRNEIKNNRSVMINGQLVKPDDPVHKTLRNALA